MKDYKIQGKFSFKVDCLFKIIACYIVDDHLNKSSVEFYIRICDECSYYMMQ